MTSPELREVTPEDTDALLDLVVLCDIAELGEADYSFDDLSADLVRTTHRGWVAVGADGTFEGYAWIERTGNHSSILADVMVRPGGDADLLARLLDQVLSARVDIDPTLSLQAWTVSGSRTKTAVFQAAGGQPVRRFWRMSIDLADSPPPSVPDLPAGVRVRAADQGEPDLRTIHEVLNTSFLEHFGHQSSTYEDWAPTHTGGSWSDHTLWWLATVDGEPAAAEIGARLPEGVGYIADLGTLPTYRGRGLARLLLLTAFAEFHRRGLRRVSLGVDATNPTGAVGLYESVGMAVRHEFTTYQFEPAS